MHPIRLDGLTAEQLRELDELYRTTRDVRVRSRAQMVLLAAEQGLVASAIGAIVRQSCRRGAWPSGSRRRRGNPMRMRAAPSPLASARGPGSGPALRADPHWLP